MAFPRRCSIPSPRWLVSRLALAVIALCVSTMLVFYALPHSRWKYPPLQRFEDYLRQRMPAPEPLVPLADRVPCYGPRGKVLSASPDDELRSVELNTCMEPFFYFFPAPPVPLLSGLAFFRLCARHADAHTPPQHIQRRSSGRIANFASSSRG